MSSPSTPYVLALIAVAAVAVTLAWTAGRRRSAPGAWPLALMMLAVAEWSLAYAFEIVSPGLPAKVAWAQVEYVGIVALPAIWLAFALEYAGRAHWLTRRTVALLALEPAAVLLLVWTNESHNLIWKDLRLEIQAGLLIWDPHYGPGFWINAVYAYVLLLLGTGLLLRGLARREAPHLFREQAGPVLVAALAPWVGNALYITRVSPLPHLDLTPFAFTASGAALAWALFRFRLLDLAPVARDLLIERLSDGVMVLNARDRVVDLNPAAGQLLGVPVGEAIGQPAAHVLSPWPDLADRIQTAGDDRTEVALDRDGSRQKWIDLHTTPLLDRHRRLTGRLVLLRDITPLKWAEAALRRARTELETQVEARTAELSDANRLLQEQIAEREQAEAELRALFAAMTDVMLVYDADGRYVRIAPTGPDLLYRPAEELLGKTVHEVLPPESADAFLGYIREALATGCTLRAEYRLDIAGREVWFEAAISPMPEADRVVWVARDISERKRAEAERERLLRQVAAERARLEAVLQKMPAGVIIAEAPSGRILLANEQMAAVWRRTDTARFLEWPCFHGDGRRYDPAETPLMRAITTGEVVTDEEVEVERGDGTRGVVSISSAPIRDDAGRIVADVSVYLDVTDQRRLEEELAKADKLESIGVLAGGIAHDFNNLLTAILANVSLAKLTSDPAGQASRRLAEAEKASLRAKDLTQRLVTFAQGGAPIRRPTAIGELAREYAGLALAGSNVRAEFDLPNDLWPVEADPGQLGQVVQNLALNARQAQPEGGTLRVEATNLRLMEGHGLPLPSGPYVRLAVVDRGAGIPAEVLPKVFDPFFTTKPGGHGLGLAIAFSIVRKHGGHLTVESEVGAGTAATVSLPASAPAAPASATTAPPIEFGAMEGQGYVLLMDDEASLRTVACEVLAALGYEAVAARDGAEAVALYRQAWEAGRPFDLVLLDLTVPGGMGGANALRRLRAHDPNVAAIVCSGYANDPIMTDHARHGFVGALVKPYTADELWRAVRAALEGAKRDG